MQRTPPVRVRSASASSFSSATTASAPAFAQARLQAPVGVGALLQLAAHSRQLRHQRTLRRRAACDYRVRLVADALRVGAQRVLHVSPRSRPRSRPPRSLKRSHQLRPLPRGATQRGRCGHLTRGRCCCCCAMGARLLTGSCNRSLRASLQRARLLLRRSQPGAVVLRRGGGGGAAGERER